jgi:hypothetical protein
LESKEEEIVKPTAPLIKKDEDSANESLTGSFETSQSEADMTIDNI